MIIAQVCCSVAFIITKEFWEGRVVLRLETIMQVMARRLCASHEEWRILLKSL